MWYVYLLECSDGSVYTGITTDLQRRLKQHQAGQGSAYTRAKGPVRFLFRERHPTRSSALRREAQIKKLTPQNKRKLSRAGIARAVRPPAGPARLR